MRLPQIAWRKAEYLVVEKGLTLEQTAEATGISLSALKTRSQKKHWQERRKAACSFREMLGMGLHSQMERMLSDSEAKPDGIYKVAKAYRELTAVPEAGDAERLDQFWKALTDTVATDGGEDLRRCWAAEGGQIRECLERRLGGGEGADGKPARRKAAAGISPDTVARIKNAVLGVGN